MVGLTIFRNIFHAAGPQSQLHGMSDSPGLFFCERSVIRNASVANCLRLKGLNRKLGLEVWILSETGCLRIDDFWRIYAQYQLYHF